MLKITSPRKCSKRKIDNSFSGKIRVRRPRKCGDSKNIKKIAAMCDGDSGDGGAGIDYTSIIGIGDYCNPPKEEPEPKLGCGDGDGDVDYGLPDANDYCDYGPPKEDPESKFIDTCCHAPKEEPELMLDGDGGTVNVDGSSDCDPLKEEPEPELDATDEDAVANDGQSGGYDCSHCGVNLGTREFKVKHELRCKAQMQRREFESQITKLYHCGYCRCPFLNKEYREQHQRKWCRKKPVAKRRGPNGACFECDKCEYVTKGKQNFARHVLNHDKNNAEWFTCAQCSYKTVHKKDMADHMKIHDNNFSCCCPICGKSFKTKRCLDNHLLKLHSDESEEVSKLITSKVYTCNICNEYRTTEKKTLNAHVTFTHHKGVGCQKYECPRCPFSTFRKECVNRHLKIHEEQKDYQCTICKKQFTQKLHFDSHVLYKHANELDLVKTISSKIHRCELCSFKTVVTSHLKSHIRAKHS